MDTPQDTCSNCFWWTRIDSEHGECRKYAPKPDEYLAMEPLPRPLTPQYWVACGDWQKSDVVQVRAVGLRLFIEFIKKKIFR